MSHQSPWSRENVISAAEQRQALRNMLAFQPVPGGHPKQSMHRPRPLGAYTQPNLPPTLRPRPGEQLRRPRPARPIASAVIRINGMSLPAVGPGRRGPNKKLRGPNRVCKGIFFGRGRSPMLSASAGPSVLSGFLNSAIMAGPSLHVKGRDCAKRQYESLDNLPFSNEARATNILEVFH